MYGSESWTLNRSERRKIESAKMRFLRRVSGYTHTDHIPNTTIRDSVQPYSLEERIQDHRN
jgi:hypothetical protein